MNKTKKLLAAGIMIAALGLLGTRQAHAAAHQDSFTMRVAIGNVVSINIEDDGGTDITDYDWSSLGNLYLGDTSVNATAIGIDNISGGLLQTYNLSIDDGASDMQLRQDNTALAINEYRVRALFQDAQPPDLEDATAFNDNDILDTLGKTATNAVGDVFAQSGTGSAEDGVSVDDDNRLAGGGIEVRLWLRLEMPPLGSTVTGVHNPFATITVTASPG